MPIQPTSGSTVIPAIPEKTIDRYWMKSLIIDAPTVKNEATATVVLIPYDSKTQEMFPSRTIKFTIDNILKTALVDPLLGNCCNVIFNEVQRQAQNRNLI
jgi:hypothetical protein